ncbi:class I SAM-dependent methyltransferase [Gammaproteobacteria bacterium]|jgi:ubiquinone/menaquinone biosynthesis C-methylase UbiE|nr:class I SAM-dependent methyltransferase [Gammaproteobacteria bacterium]
MDQKDIFKKSEGDAWYLRNQEGLKNKDMGIDPIVSEVQNLISAGLVQYSSNETIRILEIGCGDGSRGKYISKLIQCEYFGIDPSQLAVATAAENGLIASVGTADELPYDDSTFDIIIYGFCLYLCDRKDLRAISSEANRVLKQDSWLIVLDFFADEEKENIYHHHKSVKSFKMDYRQVFEMSHPYKCYFHKVIDHETYQYTFNKDNWIAVSLLKKNAV